MKTISINQYEEKENIAQDILQGAGQIAAFLGMSRRSVYYYAERQELPVFKIGSQLYARRSTLCDHISELEKGHRGDLRVGLLSELSL